MDQLKQSGLNDQQLQALRNSGAIDQILEQGDVDKALKQLDNEGKLDQRQASHGSTQAIRLE